MWATIDVLYINDVETIKGKMFLTTILSTPYGAINFKKDHS